MVSATHITVPSAYEDSASPHLQNENYQKVSSQGPHSSYDTAARSGDNDNSDNGSNDSFPDIRVLAQRVAERIRANAAAGTPNNYAAAAQVGPVQDPSTTGHGGRPEGQRQQNVEIEDNMENEFFEIKKIRDWRYASDDTCDIELLVEWREGYEGPRATWEPESEIQMTAGEVVWGYWESLDNTTGGYARNRALGLDENCNMYVPLRVTGHRQARAAAKKSKRRYTGGHRARRQVGRPASQSARVHEYQIEWVGYRQKTWEPADNLDRKLLDSYRAVCSAVGGQEASGRHRSRSVELE